MMATSLTAAIDSDYIHAGNVIRGVDKDPEIYVYVEGLDDICFWNELLKPFSKGRNFIITQLRKIDNSIAEGKRNLIDTIDINTLGPCKYIAVDADYDWLIENYKTSPTTTSVSEIIRHNQFVLHTYLYSIENFKCHPKCVESFITKASGKVNGINPTLVFSNISKLSSRLFLIHLASAHNCDGVYTLKDFRQDMSSVSIKQENGNLSENTLKYFASREEDLAKYETTNSDLIELYRHKLLKAGFLPEQFYLFFQGHIVANTLTKKLFTPIILNSRIEIINDLLSTPIPRQAEDKLKQYEKITGISRDNRNSEISSRIDQLIFDSTDSHFAEKGYQMIHEHLSKRFH
ncbi:MAG: DUF4435 domain-containing protein [Muribaculaceae bacterium]|nr:DUF4435 domain-containing protein [Muribaculaceae bacterium]